MPVMPSKFRAKSAARKLSWLSVLALSVGLANAWGAAPSVVIDAERILGSGYNGPQAIAVNNTNQGAIFIADTGNNQIVALLTTGVNHAFTPPNFKLSNPQGVALDAKGNLFIADSPTKDGTSFGRIIEMPADNTGNMIGTARLVFSGAPLSNPVSLTVDSSGTLFIGDFNLTTGVGHIYSLAAGGTKPELLDTGLPTTIFPAALVRDSSTNLYIADNASFNGGIYTWSIVGKAHATAVPTQSFVINQPSGLALDTAGNLYIMSLIGSGATGQQVVEVPAASPASPFIIPNSGILNGSGMEFDAAGNLDVLDFANAAVFQLSYVSPTNLGKTFVGFTSQSTVFNFEFNAPTTLRGFRIVTEGDVSTDVTQTDGSCVNGKHDNVPGGGPIAPDNPYSCFGSFAGTPTFPGLRTSSILVRGADDTVLASTPVYQTAFAGAEVVYPLNASVTATNLQQPQALAISGQNKTVYVADTLAGKVYSTKNLGGTALTPVSTGNIPLVAPIALALDGAGNLFIADFGKAEVIEVPTATGGAPSVVNTGGLLKNPIALTFDYLGNLYIGDAGPAGFNADASDPGYVVKLPVGGTAFKMTIPSVSVIYPQSLTTDIYSAALYIGDGGDPSGVGQVVTVSTDGTTASKVPSGDVSNPSGLGFDPAGNLYVLDGTSNTITVDPVNQTPVGAPYQLPFDNKDLSSASALAVSAGGQSFLIGNIGNGSTNELVLLNGNHASLKFGSVKQGVQSPTKTATVFDIGNLPMTLSSPYFSTNAPNAAFTVLGSSTCGDNLMVAIGGSCTINAQFKPSEVGLTTQEILVNSGQAYNSGTPILTLRGTGTVATSAAADDKADAK
jgi:sugar lactone lactonase YvrE